MGLSYIVNDVENWTTWGKKKKVFYTYIGMLEQFCYQHKARLSISSEHPRKGLLPVFMLLPSPLNL